MNKRQMLLEDAFVDRQEGINNPHFRDHIRQYLASKFYRAAFRGFKPGYDQSEANPAKPEGRLVVA